VARGRITRFGSVFVNGVEYETGTTTTFTIDDRSGRQDDLRVGQIVTIRATVPATGNPRATSIVYEGDIEGPVTSVNVAASSLVVLGQTVVVDAGTSFDSSLPDGLGSLAGRFVEVSGLRNADGVLVASRIEAKSALTTVELLGTVSALDSGARNFRIGKQIVDYGGATLTDGGPADGATVEVEGSVDNLGTLVATRVERKSGLGGANGDRAEVEGYVTSFVSASDFVVNGQPVSTGGGTVFEGTGTLGPNAFIEVEGAFNASGILVANKVQFRIGNDSRLTATVDSVNTASGTFVALGVTVRTNALTRFEDKSSLDVESFDLGDLRAGDYVEVVGGVDANGTTLIAARVERDDPETRLELRGLATAVDGQARTLVILGVTVQTNGGTEYRDASDASISASTFFAGASGRVVQVRGTLNGQVIVADRLEIES